MKMNHFIVPGLWKTAPEEEVEEGRSGGVSAHEKQNTQLLLSSRNTARGSAAYLD